MAYIYSARGVLCSKKTSIDVMHRWVVRVKEHRCGGERFDLMIR